MRFVIDTGRMFDAVKSFVLYDVLKRPRPKIELEDLVQVVIALAAAHVVMDAMSNTKRKIKGKK